MRKSVIIMKDKYKKKPRTKKGPRIISAEELRTLRDPYSVKAQTIIKKVSENLLHVKRDELLEGYLYLYGCQKEAITKH